LLEYDDFPYLVTCRHVADFLGDHPFLIRINSFDGGSENLHLDEVRWFYDVDPTVDVAEGAFEVREPSLGGYVSAAEPLSPPFGDRMQRRVLQQLRAAPFEPAVRGLTQPTMKFVDQTRLAEARLADDQH
jgi:hypothetical protein